MDTTTTDIGTAWATVKAQAEGNYNERAMFQYDLNRRLVKCAACGESALFCVDNHPNPENRIRAAAGSQVGEDRWEIEVTFQDGFQSTLTYTDEASYRQAALWMGLEV